MTMLKREGAHNLPLPARQSEGAGGYDLQLCGPSMGGVDRKVFIYPGQRLMIGTGFAWKIPHGHVGLVRPRSGLAVRQGVDVLAGVIDRDYTGEVKVVLINLGETAVELAHGERIAQMVVVAINTDDLHEVESLDVTERGAGGFGSTGKAADRVFLPGDKVVAHRCLHEVVHDKGDGRLLARMPNGMTVHVYAADCVLASDAPAEPLHVPV